MSVTLKDMQLFVAVYEEQSFTAAALREGATQSGVSQRILKLEKDLGLALFFRAGTGIVPTPAAQHYYHECTNVLRAHEKAGAAVRAFARGLDGQVSLGIASTLARSVIAPAVIHFSELYPNVLIQMAEGSSAVLLPRLQAGELEAVVLPAGPTPPGVLGRQFVEMRLWIVSGQASRIPHGVPVSLTDIGEIKLVLPSAKNQFRVVTDTYFSANGVRISRLLELDSLLSILGLVAVSDWVTILPEIAIIDRMHGNVLLNGSPISTPPLVTDLTVYQLARVAISPATQAFLDILQETALNLLRGHATPAREGAA